MDSVRALLRTYLFQDLSPAEVDALANLARARRLTQGEHAFRVGDCADELWVVVSGQIKEYVLSRDGQEYVFEVYVPGAVFGEPGVFSRERTRVVNEVAMEETVLLALDRGHLFDFLMRHPPAMLRLLEGLSADVRGSVDEAVSLAYARLRGRVLTRLVQLADAQGDAAAAGVRIDLGISQSVLGAMVGATRENVNRALAPLIAAGCLRVGQAGMTIVDLDELCRLADLHDPLLHRRNRQRDER